MIFSDLLSKQVVKRIRSFKLLECPDGCPRKVYLLMRACWKYEQSKRMPFKKIQEMLAGWLEGRGEFLDEAWEEMQKPPLKNSGAHSESKNSTPPVPARTRLKTPQENTPP